MSTTPNMSLVLPVDHASTDLWGAILNTVFPLIDSHDHTTGKGVQIQAAALKINADVAWSFGGVNYAITALSACDFTPVAAASVTAYSSALFANSSDANNLYYRNSAGTNVKITSGSTLNVSIVGGIGGDYASVGALLSFDDATDSYWLQQQGGPRPWARVRVGDVDIYETAASITNRVRIQSPAALAASYALTLPPAVAASAGLFLQSDVAGVLSWSNTTAQAITAPTVVATASMTAPSFHNTGGYTTVVHAAEATPDQLGGATAQFGFSGTAWSPAVNTGKVVYPIPVRYQAGVTTKLDGWTIYFRKTSASGTITAALKYETGGVITAIGTSQTNAANNPGYVSFTVTALAHTIASGRQYWVEINGGGVGTDEFHQLDVNFVDV